MKVRILLEQVEHSSQPDRPYIGSGEVVDLPDGWANELLESTQAEKVDDSVEVTYTLPAADADEDNADDKESN